MDAIRLLALSAALLLAPVALAGEEKVKLKEAPGLDLVRQNCIACHSLDYIPLNSPFLDRKGWDAVVAKMTKAMGAPIAEKDAAPIAEYLDKYYGKR